MDGNGNGFTPWSEHYALRERVSVMEKGIELKLNAIDDKLDRALAAKSQNTLPVPYVPPPAPQPLISKDDIANMVRQAKGGSSNVITLAVIGMIGLFAYLFLHKLGAL